MGKAARWFRALLGGKKRWGFGKSSREKEKRRHEKVVEERKSSYSAAVVVDDEDDQNKRAIAVAAASAAVAEAAIAAAQAAAAVVRLTSSSRSVGMKREERAAVKIQSAFRGYLARRALKALKGLVRLQALVRGNIVRKKAAETMRCMQALVQVQARARACREPIRSTMSSRSNPGSATPDKYEPAVRPNSSNTNRSGSLRQRNSSKQTGGIDAVHGEIDQSANWNWLDQWMEERYWDCIEASKAMDDEKNAKVLEVDTGKPQNNSKRHTGHNQLHSPYPNMNSDHVGRNLMTAQDSPSKDSTSAQLLIPSPSPIKRRHLATPMLRFPALDLGESPQFYSATSRPGSSRRGPFTPGKSECSRSLFNGYTDYPNYMANTESSTAKVRSNSAPRQRPGYEKSSSMRRLSSPGLGTQGAATKFANKAYPGSGRLDRLGRPLRI